MAPTGNILLDALAQTIEHIDDEMRELIEDQWPDLAAKLPRPRPN